MMGTLRLGVGERECDLSEATRLPAAGPSLEPRPAVNPALLLLGHRVTVTTGAQCDSEAGLHSPVRLMTRPEVLHQLLCSPLAHVSVWLRHPDPVHPTAVGSACGLQVHLPLPTLRWF